MNAGVPADGRQTKEEIVDQDQERKAKRDPLAELESRIDAAIEDARPKLKKALEELDARVDAAMKEVRPRVDSAMEDVRPRVDQLLSDAQPRLDSVLARIQLKIGELRDSLEARRTERETPDTDIVALPRTGDATPEGSDTPGGGGDQVG